MIRNRISGVPVIDLHNNLQGHNNENCYSKSTIAASNFENTKYFDVKVALPS